MQAHPQPRCAGAHTDGQSRTVRKAPPAVLLCFPADATVAYAHSPEPRSSVAAAAGDESKVTTTRQASRTLLSPQYAFALAALIAAGAAALCLAAVLHAPWFGVQLDRSPERVGMVIAVDPAAAALGIEPGDRVVAFAAPTADPVALQPLSLVSDLDHAASFPTLRQLFAHLDALYEATRHSTSVVIMDDGRRLTLERSNRSLGMMPPGIWVMVAGVIPFMVGAGVWSYRGGNAATRLLLLAGTSFMVIALSNLLYAYRQPTVDPQLLQYAVQANRLGTFLFFYSYVALFWIYPFRLGPVRVVGGLLTIALLLFVNEVTQTIHWPGDPFAFPIVVSLPVCFAFIAMQWWHSRGNPVERAVLLWFALAMMVGMVLVTGLYFLPSVLGAPPILALELAFAVGVISYLGLMLAVVRYRLFQLGRWWLSAWMWLLGGSAIVVLDLLVAHALNVASTYVIVISIFIVGWMYFPVRQWLWRHFVWHGRSPMEWVPAELLEAVAASRGDADLRASWASLLDRIFEPLQISRLAGTPASPAPAAEGLTLRVPDLVGPGSIELAYRNGGRRLFSPDDGRLVASLIHMVRPAIESRQAQQAARQLERKRIMRDLHDDVGSRLLTLTRRLRDPAEAESARAALHALRETIFRLNRPEGSDLAAALADWRYEMAERLDSHGIGLHWQEGEDLPPIVLDAEQRANIGQVLREAVSNAVRHAQPSRLDVMIDWRDGVLHGEVSHDGRTSEAAQWVPGTGMANIQYRMQRLDGAVSWHSTTDRTCMRWHLPIAPASAVPEPGPLRAPQGTPAEHDEGRTADDGEAAQHPAG